MKFTQGFSGLFKGRAKDVLPEEFDPQSVQDFFSKKFHPAEAKSGGKAAPDAGARAVPFDQTVADDVTEDAGEDTDDTTKVFCPVCGSQSCGCPPEEDDNAGQTAEDDYITAAAKPDWSGRGKNSNDGSGDGTTDSGGKGNKGGNKGKKGQQEEEPPVEEPPAEEPPAEEPPAEEPPVEEPPAEEPPAEDPPAEEPPVEEPPAEDPPTEDPPAEEPPAEEPPAEDPPTEDPPAEDPPAEEPPAEDPPASDNWKTEASDHVTGMNNPDGYNISIDFSGDGWTDNLKAAFIEGAEMVSEIVTGDVADRNGVDDLHITATIEDLGGPGGAFARGGATSVNPETGLTTEGVVRLDIADLGTMQQYDIVGDFAFHEILHAMGFGTTWGNKDLTEDFNGDLRFTGANAIEAYNTQYSDVAEGDNLSSQGVPLDGDGDHWDHGVFPTEILSPRLNASNNIISDLTIASLEDMGYETIYGDDPAAGEFEDDLIPLV